ncbi:MAG TPA: hypothetical protein VNU97_14015 [Rhizomicrobium sp.]|jgi:hypothetical protein|nr:hypothetical protein [Rhizomicrobium sp.]
MRAGVLPVQFHQTTAGIEAIQNHREISFDTTKQLLVRAISQANAQNTGARLCSGQNDEISVFGDDDRFVIAGITPDVAVLRLTKPEIEDMDSVMAFGSEVGKQLSRNMNVADEENAHFSGLFRCFDDGMVECIRGVGQRRPNIVCLKEVEISQNFFGRHPACEHLENVNNAHTVSPDTGTTAHFARLNRDALQQVFRHLASITQVALKDH